jgi:hypothetical protein
VNALANDEVGRYLNAHFVSSFQKVGTFQVANGQKNGGNVASYLCLSDGSVLHAVAGPVDAATLLREARWVVETRKLAMTTSRGNFDRYRLAFRKAHADRLQQEYHVKINPQRLAGDYALTAFSDQEFNRRLGGQAGNAQARVHWLLALFPLVPIDQVYPVVFEKILGEKVSTLPVIEGG